MGSLAIILTFLFMGVVMPPCESHELINDGNFVVVLQRKVAEMKKLTSMSEDDRRKIDERLFEVFDGTDVTDIQVARKLVNEKDRFFAQLEGQVFETCLSQTFQALQDLEIERSYALQMKAAYGKRERYLNAFYTWNTDLMGMYDICKSVQKENVYAPMETLYCEEIVTAFGVSFSRAICVPASCSNEDLLLINSAIYAELGLGNLTTRYTCIRDIPWEWDAIFVTCLLCFFASVVVLGTFYDVAFRRRRIAAINKVSLTEETRKGNSIEEGTDNLGLKLEEVEKIDDNSSITEGSTDNQSYASSFMTSKEEDEDEKENADKEGVVRTPGCKGKLDEILTSCSLVYNSSKILSAKNNSSSLSSLNGIRVLSMLWIIWSHSIQTLLYNVTDNTKYFLEDLINGYFFNATLFGTFAVDSFFVLSGLLVTYLTLKELKQKNGKLNWFLFYFHRIWRLTPSYMMAIGIWASLLIHMGVGLSKEEETLYVKETFCTKYWWTDLLYINNLYPFPGYAGGCLSWSWYLSNDMQFYIISPLFIILLFNRKTTKLGIVSVVAMCVSSCAVTAALTGYYGLPVGKSQVYYNNRTDSLEPWGASSDIIYGKPYCRIQSYMVGVFVGCIIHRHTHIKNIKMHWVVNLIGWIIGLGLMYAMVFALHNTSGQDPLPQWFSAVWGGVSRTLFSIGVAWVAFACSTGHGGLINSFLSWSLWTPMARLTYCTYLLHPMVLTLYTQTKQVPIHWTFIEFTYMFLANAVMSYFAAFCLSLLVEGPTMGLEKVMLGKSR
ncbi:Nose resistant to fluoxetine protein 6 [Holothuria leucospilota]|uniref:Nose resistant to fluoxetine protein 6 n=1 Tax=Holothuria leucospilota TaxID=206669 RepID=A0A9Q0YHU3_HOLLE|nr:Nose resistant to fluoxetine protein 6 [Holothuria leucospilota]